MYQSTIFSTSCGLLMFYFWALKQIAKNIYRVSGFQMGGWKVIVFFRYFCTYHLFFLNVYKFVHNNREFNGYKMYYADIWSPHSRIFYTHWLYYE